MNTPFQLAKYSIGVGDRFGQQGTAQLRACVLAAEKGVQVVPVWNKSNREHQIIGSDPADTRKEADAAVKALNWRAPYHVDADHIRLETVDRFIPHADFYTIDVADSIGRAAEREAVQRFLRKHLELAGRIAIPGLEKAFKPDVARIASKYLLAVQEAGRIYRHIAARKGAPFITEVSMDETDAPQAAPELLVILAAIADEDIPVQTIAPKFSGRFNKGVDYSGDLEKFETEFNEDLAVLRFAIEQYRLPGNLKLSVHSGSDKFSIYPAMRRGLERFRAGLHLKTAGTTWLEELIGLAESGGEGLAMAKEIYARALERVDELCGPYASVIEIDRGKLPRTETVNLWTAEEFVAALRHRRTNAKYNPSLRQLLHVAYKVAAELGERYLGAVRACEARISANVTQNLFERHVRPLFV